MSSAICEDCQFFDALDDGRGGGYCRCHSPVVELVLYQSTERFDTITSWPTVSKIAWCGEWFPRAPEPPDGYVEPEPH